jgi:hypothetical protein
VPVLGVGVGLQAVAADVEPHRRVEGDLLVHQQVRELGEEDLGVLGGGEVAVAHAPVADALGHAADQSADAVFAVRCTDLAVEVLGRDDVGRGDRPVAGDLDRLLLEDELALEVLDDGVAKLPCNLIEGVDARAREVAREGQARSSGRVRGGREGRLGCGAGDGGGVFGHGQYLKSRD